MMQQTRFLFAAVVWGLCAYSSQSEASCADSNVGDQGEDMDEMTSLLQIEGHSKPADAQVDCPQCKGCLEEKACYAGMTVQAYCDKHPQTHRCDTVLDPATQHCCREFTLQCKACQAQLTQYKYCIADAKKCHTYASECRWILKEFCTNLPEGTNFSWPGPYCACGSILPKPYDGPPMTVNLDCPRHAGKKLYNHPFQDSTHRPIRKSMERCIELGDDCSGVTCVEGLHGPHSPHCTVRIGSAGLYPYNGPEGTSAFSLLKAECTEPEPTDPPRRMMKMMKMKMKKEKGMR